ncbi:MAG: hypothetical protein QOH48_1951 [Actinomycetota bacterium]|jgi:hypothetical protein|nr:hypothetical protein [Actinomycetota bacterium]
MALTRGRLQNPAKTTFLGTEEAPSSSGATTGRPLSRPMRDAGEEARQRLAWSRGLLALWTVIMLSVLFEPAPNPHATVPLWAGVLSFLFLTGFFTSVFGLAGNHAWGLKASLASATLGLGMAAACAVTDHHPAFWWGYEMVAMTTLLAFNRLALKKTTG